MPDIPKTRGHFVFLGFLFHSKVGERVILKQEKSFSLWVLSDCNHGWVGLLAGFPFLRLAKKLALDLAPGSSSHFGLALFWSAFVFLSVIVMCLANN